ncbi:MAG TPA: hypothetical protein DCL44_07395 [Elusimicrobia bacterium]|nr:hypothetical protein [Elusimicrobiota bacterium]
MFRVHTICLIFLSSLIIPAPGYAGVTNPDISVIGQLIFKYHNDKTAQDAHRPTLDLGETELVFDSYLNPYAKGFFVFTVGDNEGLRTEEAYIDVLKGLPDGLALRGGKYRIGFGKLNPVHPHAYSFIEAPRVMAAMLPGEEGFNDVGAHASYLLPTFGSWASDISADFLKGASFHPDEPESRAGWASRWGNSALLNDAIPLDIGISATQGVNNAQWKTKTVVYGADIKTRIAFSGLTNLTLQGEYLYNNSEVVIDTSTGDSSRIRRQGFYFFADLKFKQRWNAGIIYDQYQPIENKNLTNRAIKGFIGFSLLEETTLLRLSYEHFKPENSHAVHTAMLQVLFSMGPHKAHKF